MFYSIAFDVFGVVTLSVLSIYNVFSVFNVFSVCTLFNAGGLIYVMYFVYSDGSKIENLRCARNSFGESSVQDES